MLGEGGVQISATPGIQKKTTTALKSANPPPKKPDIFDKIHNNNLDRMQIGAHNLGSKIAALKKRTGVR